MSEAVSAGVGVIVGGAAMWALMRLELRRAARHRGKRRRRLDTGAQRPGPTLGNTVTRVTSREAIYRQ
jgi:hypothetical protein